MYLFWELLLVLWKVWHEANAHVERPHIVTKNSRAKPRPLEVTCPHSRIQYKLYTKWHALSSAMCILLSCWHVSHVPPLPLSFLHHLGQRMAMHSLLSAASEESDQSSILWCLYGPLKRLNNIPPRLSSNHVPVSACALGWHWACGVRGFDRFFLLWEILGSEFFH